MSGVQAYEAIIPLLDEQKQILLYNFFNVQIQTM